MKVTSASGSTAASGSGGARPAAEGFRVDLGHGAGANVTAASSALGAGSIGGVSALMALQGVGGVEARSRALRKGRRLLDALDRLQVALLSEGPTRAHLSILQRALGEQREATDDPELDETLQWAEVRAAVEAAKLERAAQGR